MSYSDKRNQIDLLQEKINAYGELSPEVKKKINYRFRLDWNYYSNSMEGNTLTMDETRSVMVGNITVEGKPIKDILEIKGHDDVITEILKIGKGEVRISEARIREIHKGIMYEENDERKKKIGGWKSEPNYIYNYKGERFDFVLPVEVPVRMHELLNKTNAAIDAVMIKKTDAPHPVDIALQFHLDYVIIHPFYDGNGRTARILTNLLLISFGYPPFWVETEERKIYNQYIGDIQGYGGSSDLFFEFASGLILRSQQLELDAIEGKNIEDEEDLDKKLLLLKSEIADKDVDNEVQLNFNEEEFLKIYDSWLSELMKGIIVQIKKFDDLFVKPQHYIIIRTNIHDGSGGQTVSINFDNKSPEVLVNELKASFLSKQLFISADTTIDISANYGTFKKGALKNAFGCNYKVEVSFDYLKYQIYRTTFNAKLKHYPMINDDLKKYLRGNVNVNIIHFDAKGNPYSDAKELEDGSFVVGTSENENEEIILSYTAEDILNGGVIHGGLIRFLEPRLLHKPLTNSEIKNLSKDMGNTIFNHIDYYTKQAGLR